MFREKFLVAKRQRIGDQIDAAMVLRGRKFVSVHAHKRI